MGDQMPDSIGRHLQFLGVRPRPVRAKVRPAPGFEPGRPDDLPLLEIVESGAGWAVMRGEKQSAWFLDRADAEADVQGRRFR